jgi:hypothetical protein
LTALSGFKGIRQNQTLVESNWKYEDGKSFDLDYSSFGNGDPNNDEGREACFTLSTKHTIFDGRCWGINYPVPESLCAIPTDTSNSSWKGD